MDIFCIDMFGGNILKLKVFALIGLIILLCTLINGTTNANINNQSVVSIIAHKNSGASHDSKAYNFVGWWESFKEKNPNSLLMLLGNAFNNAPHSIIINGQQQNIDYLNMLDHDVMMLSGDDISIGRDTVLGYVDKLDNKANIVSSNLINTKTKEMLFKPYKISEINGLKICTIGYNLDISGFNNIVTNGNHNYNDYAEKIKRTKEYITGVINTAKAENKQIDVFILITDVPTYGENYIKDATMDIEGLNLVISLSDSSKKMINNVFYIGLYELIDNTPDPMFAQVDLSVDKTTKTVEVINDYVGECSFNESNVSFTAKEKYMNCYRMIDEYEKKAMKDEIKAIGLLESDVRLIDTNGFSYRINEESPIGLVFSDGIRYSTNSDFALLPYPGSNKEKDILTKGSLTKSDIINIYEQDTVYKITMSIKDIERFIVDLAKAKVKNAPGHIQPIGNFSGGKIKVFLSGKKDNNVRVKLYDKNGKSLSNDKKYKIAISRTILNEFISYAYSNFVDFDLVDSLNISSSDFGSINLNAFKFLDNVKSVSGKYEQRIFQYITDETNFEKIPFGNAKIITSSNSNNNFNDSNLDKNADNNGLFNNDSNNIINNKKAKSVVNNKKGTNSSIPGTGEVNPLVYIITGLAIFVLGIVSLVVFKKNIK